MKSRPVLWLALGLSGAAAMVFAVAAKWEQSQLEHSETLRVIVVASTNRIRIKEPFSIALRVENATTINQTVRVMCCSWEDEWKCSNPKIPWGGQECDKNLAVDVAIPPGGAYTNLSPMCVYDFIPDKAISFRMGFTSIGSKKVFWSNKVRLEILTPDTWQRGGAIYRDRNHDGKIDWEVSGNTWGQHGVDVYKVDTNFDGFYDVKYGAGGTNGQIQWRTNVHELVPRVGKDMVPAYKQVWFNWWKL